MPDSNVIRGFTLTQPWASMMALGHKSFETRSWRTSYRGRIAIHAAKGWGRDEMELCLDEPFRSALIEAGYHSPGGLPRGVIVAVGVLQWCGPTETALRCFTPEEHQRELPVGNYERGRFAWRVTDIAALAEPIICRGALSLWQLPADIEARLLAIRLHGHQKGVAA